MHGSPLWFSSIFLSGSGVEGMGMSSRTCKVKTKTGGVDGQIRMHAVSLGHPILGDSLYGTEEGKAKSDRLLLHASRLCFKHVSPASSAVEQFYAAYYIAC